MQTSRAGSSGSLCAGWPLAGRTDELTEVERLLAAEELGGIVIAGGVGTGKTALLSEVLCRAEQRGLATQRAVATRASSSISLGGLAHLVPAPDTANATSFDRLRLGIDTFLSRAEGTGLVLGVDDAHLLDDASATLLHHLTTSASVLVVATVHGTERIPDAVLAMARERAARRLDLGPLSRHTVEELLAGVLGGAVERRTLFELWSSTRGNPLLLRELVEGGRETGRLREANGVWRWQGSLLVPRVMEAVRVRLADLSPSEREAAETIAFAESASLPLAAALTDDRALHSLERRALVRLDHEGRRRSIQFSHRLFGEVVRADTSPLRAQQICAQLADWFDSFGTRRRDELVRATRWRLDAGRAVEPDELLDAVRHARSSGSAGLAEDLARAAVGRGGGTPARVELAAVLADQRRCTEAEAELAIASAEARTEQERSAIAELRAANLFWGLGRPADAQQVLESVEQSIAEADLRDGLRATRAFQAFLTGRPEEALTTVRPALRRRGASPHVVARSLVHAIPAWAVQGDTDQAAAGLEHAASIDGQIDQPLGLTGDLRVERSFVLAIAGDLRAAEQVAEEGFEQALAAGDQQRQALMGMAVGHAILGQGRAGQAATWLQEAADLLRPLETPGLVRDCLPWCLADLARAHALDSDRGAARRALVEAKGRLRPTVRIIEPAVTWAQAWTHVAADEHREAQAAFLKAADLSRDVGQTAIEAAALYEAGVIGEASTVVVRLEAVAERFDGNLVGAFAAHLRAAAVRDAAGLAAAAERLEAAGALLAAGTAWADAAAVVDQRKARRRAAWARSQSARLMAECGVRRLPGSREVETVPLTPREQEIVALAARRLPSREIARRLVVSVRTVENHLYQAYGKLGVSGRAELARLFGGTGSANVT